MVLQVWDEWMVGLPGQRSLADMESQRKQADGKSWRSGVIDKQRFSERRALVQMIQDYASRRKVPGAEAATELRRLQGEFPELDSLNKVSPGGHYGFLVGVE